MCEPLPNTFNEVFVSDLKNLEAQHNIKFTKTYSFTNEWIKTLSDQIKNSKEPFEKGINNTNP